MTNKEYISPNKHIAFRNGELFVDGVDAEQLHKRGHVNCSDIAENHGLSGSLHGDQRTKYDERLRSSHAHIVNVQQIGENRGQNENGNAYQFDIKKAIMTTDHQGITE